jgi:predicted acetyltransferase
MKGGEDMRVNEEFSDKLYDDEFIRLDEGKEKVGFSLVCNNCGLKKAINFNVNQLFDFSNMDIDVNSESIYCDGCKNTL